MVSLTDNTEIFCFEASGEKLFYDCFCCRVVCEDSMIESVLAFSILFPSGKAALGRVFASSDSNLGGTNHKVLIFNGLLSLSFQIKSRISRM